MALKGIKVLEFAGLAPAPFCGMILADFGASVIRIDKPNNNTTMDCLANGKMSLGLDLKNPKSIKIIKELSKKSDIVLEPFRKGIMEKLGLGPDILCKENPRLIYARLTGYGQKGQYSTMAGHDINYLGLSGLLSMFGRAGEKPIFPVNLAADFGGGGMMCALGILLALIERNTSGHGQVVDNNMVESTAYLGSWLYRSQKLPMVWGNARGKNLLDTGAHFYEVYRTKDDRFVTVGAIEAQFYAVLLHGLGLTEEEVDQYDFEAGKLIFEQRFLEKTQKEWCEIFDGTDACVAPVLDHNHVDEHVHNRGNGSFCRDEEGTVVPKPAPSLSRTPGVTKSGEKSPEVGEHTEVILKSLGYSREDIRKLASEGVIVVKEKSKL